MSRARLHDLVVSDWTARAVLRYWRLCRWLERPLAKLKPLSLRPPETLLAHVVVLGLGFLLVASALSAQISTRDVAAERSSSSVVWSAPFSAAIAPQVNEPAVTEKIEIGPPTATPAAPSPPPAPTPAPRAKPAVAAPAQAVPAPPPGSGGSGVAAIYAVFGNSPGLSWALRVAKCESGYNPLAVNRSSGASGLFQFMPSTWNANFPGWNIWDPVAQSKAALAFYNAGRQSAWTCR